LSQFERIQIREHVFQFEKHPTIEKQVKDYYPSPIPKIEMPISNDILEVKNEKSKSKSPKKKPKKVSS
jgi:hypothetical protein